MTDPKVEVIFPDARRWDIFSEVVKSRRSIRGFRPDPVPADKLQEIFELAQRAPSNCNTQPWKLWVVSGERCNALRKKVNAAWNNGEMSMDFPYDGQYDGVYKDRQYGAANALYSAHGIKREDKAERNRVFLKNFEFFDAPHVAFVFLPEPFGIREAADLGMYAQNLMLSMAAAGVGSCPQTALSFMADMIREELEIDASNKLLFGISFGYPDPGHPANACVTERASADTTVFIN